MTVKSIRARALPMMKAASLPLNRVLRGTRTAPAVCRPSWATAHSRQFGPQMATRSPGSIPEAMKARAARSTSAASSTIGQRHVAVHEGLGVTEPLGGPGHDRADRLGEFVAHGRRW